jgi:hypothetical protein
VSRPLGFFPPGAFNSEPPPIIHRVSSAAEFLVASCDEARVARMAKRGVVAAQRRVLLAAQTGRLS